MLQFNIDDLPKKPKPANVCPNCGATMIISGYRWHCDYCGTEVDNMEQVIVRVDRPGMRIARAKTIVNKELFYSYPSDIEDHIKKDLCYKLAEFIMQNGGVSIDIENDPCTNEVLYSAKVRFLDKETKL